jgi:Secretion system C-terminal sorting domain/Carboxypeptidase regulatory-like domain
MRKAFLLTFVMLFVAAYAFANVDVQSEAALKAADKFEIQTPGDPVIDEAGGPDDYGYIYRDSDEPDGPTYNWVDITATGTNVAAELSDDDHSGPYPMGFTFNFYGTSYTDFYIQSNGVISFFDQYVSLGNSSMPSASYGAMIGWFWDDLDPNMGQNGESVFYETVMIDNQQALVVEFYEYDEYPDDPANYDITAEVILFSDGSILMQYAEIMPIMDIAGCTIGIQDDTGTIGLEVLFNGNIPNYPFNNLAIEFAVLPGDADVSGTVTDAVTGDQMPGVSVTIGNQTVLTNGSGFYEIFGTYSGDIAADLTFAGYDPISQGITLDPGPNDYDFDMIPQYLLEIEPLAGTSVPPGGGVITYAAQLTNPTPFASLMTGWTWAELPDGINVYGPIVQAPLNVQSGTTTVPQLALQVPSYAPSGVYVYHAAIGSFPNVIYSEDIFYFWKFAPGAAEGEWSGTQWDEAIAGTADAIVMPKTFEIAKVYPNPFNPTATVEITLPEVADLSVRVYNVTGQMVAELASGQFNAGSHNLTIDGSALASGVYFVHTQVPGQINNMQKITLLK